MAELGLFGRPQRRFVTTTDSNHEEPIAANRLQRDFSATRPDQKWLGGNAHNVLQAGWRVPRGGIAMMESFFGSLKTEWIDTGYATEAQARMELFKYIEMFYNPTRRHSALDYLSPAQYERRYEAGQLTPMEQAALC